MSVPVSRRVQRVKPSPTLAVTARAARLKAEGHDIIGLGAGEPDFDTPIHIADAGVAAIRSGFTRYTAVEGINELKDAIIGKFRRDNGLDYTRAQVLVSSGAKQTVYNLCAAILDPEDEAIIPAPYWVSYPDMVLLSDGKPVTVFAGRRPGLQDHARPTGSGDYAPNPALSSQQPLQSYGRGVHACGTGRAGRRAVSPSAHRDRHR